jgi:hypothetical protein
MEAHRPQDLAPAGNEKPSSRPPRKRRPQNLLDKIPSPLNKYPRHEEDYKMKWVLFVILASTAGEKTINSTTVPMATEQLCNAAKEKLTQAYRNTQSPQYALVAECLQAN